MKTMKTKILNYLSTLILGAGVFAANTPSQLGSYQLDPPKNLKR